MSQRSQYRRYRFDPSSDEPKRTKVRKRRRLNHLTSNNAPCHQNTDVCNPGNAVVQDEVNFSSSDYEEEVENCDTQHNSLATNRPSSDTDSDLVDQLEESDDDNSAVSAVDGVDDNSVDWLDGESPAGSESESHHDGQSPDVSLDSMEDAEGGDDRENFADQPYDDLLRPAEAIHPQVDFDESVPIPGELSTPVHDGTNITEGEILLMVLSLGLRHSLSYVAMSDILNLVKVICGKEDLKSSKYYLLKYCEPSRAGELLHFFCPECNSYLGFLRQIEDDSSFQCSCGATLNNLKSVKSYFLTMGLKDQLTELFKLPEVVENLNYRTVRRRINEDSIEDVFDGDCYQRLAAEGQPLSNPNNFSFTFNTDGYPIGKSSSQQGWPVFISINELPPKLRAKHILLAGLWVGSNSPDMEMFLQPFVDELNDLSSHGITWNRNGEVTKSLFVPLCCCVDSQARWKVLNMRGCSGYQACTWCEHPGDRIRVLGARYKLHLNPPPLRTDESLRAQMIEAYERHIGQVDLKLRAVKGVKGISGLFNLAYFNLVDGMTPDSMHLLKGLVKGHLKLLLKKVSEDDMILLNSRIDSLCLPSIITRSARLLKDLKKFKASEFLTFLLFHVIVIFKGLVPDKYLSHFGLLSSAIYLLLQKSITPRQLNHANELIVAYVYLSNQYFGDRVMVFNMHILLHVVKSVNDLGPLWAHNCYSFESKNGALMLMQKSASHVVKEVARKYKLFQSIPHLCEKFDVSDEVLDFCTKLSNRPLKFIVSLDNCILLGKELQHTFTAAEEQCLTLSGIDLNEVDSVTSFNRMLLGGLRLTTSSYCARMKRNDSVVCLRDNVKCRIVRIAKINGFQSSQVKIFAEELVESQRALFSYENYKISHIKEVLHVGQLLMVSPQDILGQCILTSIDIGTFVSFVPYGCMVD